MKTITHFILILLLSFFSINFAHSDELSDAKKYIENNVNESFKALSTPNLTDAQRYRRAITLLEEHLSFPAIARLSIGHHWRNMSELQRTNYEKLFENWVKKSTAKRIAALDHTKQGKIKVIDAKQNKKNFIVTTEASLGDATVNLGWNIRKLKHGLKVIDLNIEGVSMVQTQRAEFNALIEREGSIEAFLDVLRTMLANIEK